VNGVRSMAGFNRRRVPAIAFAGQPVRSAGIRSGWTTIEGSSR
jgi:hypothetical protein